MKLERIQGGPQARPLGVIRWLTVGQTHKSKCIPTTPAIPWLWQKCLFSTGNGQMAGVDIQDARACGRCWVG